MLHSKAIEEKLRYAQIPYGVTLIEWLDLKIDQYGGLKKQRVFIDSRMSELNKDIKKELLRSAYATDIKTFSRKTSTYSAEVKVRDLPGYDPEVLEDILWKKGLWPTCSKRIIDEQAVEEAYYEGKLTDEDMRKAKSTKFNLALSVEPLDVQE